MRFRILGRPLKDTEGLIRLCQRLIRRKSYSGAEEQAVEEIEKFCDESGIKDVRRDAYGSCIVSLKGRNPGPSLLFDAPIDTVPADEKTWSFDPFAAEIHEGRIYGRGSSDMKGALAAMLWGARSYYRETDGDFAGEIHIAAVVQEECFEGIAARQISTSLKPDLVVIGEASNLNLKIGQRGRAEILLETFGRNAHSANPDEGRNAVYDMTRLIEGSESYRSGRMMLLARGLWN